MSVGRRIMCALLKDLGIHSRPGAIDSHVGPHCDWCLSKHDLEILIIETSSSALLCKEGGDLLAALGGF
jgi:hypothetical protein